MNSVTDVSDEILPPHAREFYLRSLSILDQGGAPYLVGGAYSLGHHAGIIRHTKDIDIFVKPEDCGRVLEQFKSVGYRTELTFPHWLGKAQHGDELVDVIFGSGNGLCKVDDEWFAHAIDGEVLGRPVKLCPVEEIIWTKSFIQERNRFDGSDIAHLLLHRGQALDWSRLMRRFIGHEPVLLAHVLLFQYIYPSARGNVPQWVIDELYDCAQQEPPANGRVCRGTNLSRREYIDDIGKDGFEDARVLPRGPLRAEDVAYWTYAIDRIK